MAPPQTKKEDELKEKKEEVEGGMEVMENDPSQIRFMDSSRGKKVLVYQGYIFHISSTVKASTYFKCSYKFKGCRAGVILKNYDRDLCTFESFTVPPRQHSNHLPDPEKIIFKERRMKEKDLHARVIRSSKHLCLFCMASLPPGYLDISSLEKILPSGDILSVPLDDPIKNAQSFDLLCSLLNVKWRRSRGHGQFDQRRCLPLCTKCQDLYQEIVQINQQIQELQVLLNKRVKIVRERIEKSVKGVGDSREEEEEQTQLELLGLHVFRKKVVDPAFNRGCAEDEVNIGRFSKSECPSLEESKFTEYLVKQEVEEVDQVLSELLDNGGVDTSWLGENEDNNSNSAVMGEDSLDMDSVEVEDIGDEVSPVPSPNSGDVGGTIFIPREDGGSERRRSSRRAVPETIKDDHDHVASSAEEDDDNDRGSDANYSEQDENDSDSDFDLKPTPRPSRLLERGRYQQQKRGTAYKPKRETAVSTCHICSSRIVGHKSFLKHYQTHHPKERRYTCIFCKKHYNRVNRVIAHQRNKHTGEKPFPCPSCSSAFASLELLKMHISNRHSDITYPCPQCDKIFPTKAMVTNHLTAIHNEAHKEQFYRKSKKPVKILTCHLCDAQIMGQGPFLQHYKDLHPEEKRFTCKICKRHFPYIRECLAHQRRHTGERPLKCEDCGKAFAHDKALAAHRHYLHSNREKIFACTLCPRKYSARSYLTAHMNAHKQHVLICKSCGRTFRALNSFQKHNLRLHDGKADCTKPVTDPSSKETLQSLGVTSENIQCRRKCHVCMAPIPSKLFMLKHFAECHPNHPGDYLTCRCGEKFSSYKKVFNHSSRKHPGADKPYQCDQCPMTFLTSTEWRSHSRTHIPVEERQRNHMCETCGIGVASEYALVRHMRKHIGVQPRHVCELCGKSYAEIKGLQQHNKTEHLKILPHKCPHEGCGKAFPLKSILMKHVNIHTGEKSYRCGVCGKNFHYAGSLSRHLREVHNAKGEKGQTPRKKKGRKGGGVGEDGDDAEGIKTKQEAGGIGGAHFLADGSTVGVEAMASSQYYASNVSQQFGERGGGGGEVETLARE